MRRLAAQQAAQRHDGVNFAQVGDGAGGDRNLPSAGNPNHFNLSSLSPAAQQGVQRTLKQPLGNHSIPARGNYGEFHARRR